ncbi:MAG: ATP-binding protein [Nanoarchaeota archaeon]
MENTIEILKKWNPWEKQLEKSIPRKKYLSQIYPLMNRKEVLVLKGIRRSGKSTIITQLINKLLKDGVNKKQILYLNLEDYGFADKLEISLFDEILKTYKGYTKNQKKIYFFIDEIQKISCWEKWIRTKYDLKEDIKFIVSGSSASLLSKELSTLLTGRNLSFTIFTLSYKEYLEFNKKGTLENYLAFGGFPEVVLEDSKEKKEILLQQYFEDIIHKDIIDRHNIRNTKQVFNLARYLVSTSGSKVSINKLSKVFGISKETISNYLDYMMGAFLLFEVTYFSFSAKIRYEVSKLPKIYSSDSGFIKIVSIKYTKDKGQMYENAVFRKLIEQSLELSYWGEDHSEVDFIIGNKAINVTATDKIPKREFQGLEDFNKKHKRFESIIVADKKQDIEKSIIGIEQFLRDEKTI